MRFYVILLFVLVLSGINADEGDYDDDNYDDSDLERIFEDEILQTLECLRGVLKEGIEEVGMPSFEPLQINELLINLEELNIPETTGYVNLSKVSLAGLTDWDLSNLSIKMGWLGGINVKLSGNLVLPNTSLKTGYQTNLTATGISIYGNGEIDITLIETSVDVDAKLFVTPLSVEKFRVAPSLDDIDFKITGFLNDEKHSELVSQLGNTLVPKWVNEKSEDIADAIEQFVKNLLHRRMRRDINDIVNAILQKCPILG